MCYVSTLKTPHISPVVHRVPFFCPEGALLLIRHHTFALPHTTHSGFSQLFDVHVLSAAFPLSVESLPASAPTSALCLTARVRRYRTLFSALCASVRHYPSRSSVSVPLRLLPSILFFGVSQLSAALLRSASPEGLPPSPTSHLRFPCP